MNKSGSLIKGKAKIKYLKTVGASIHVPTYMLVKPVMITPHLMSFPLL